MARYNQMTGGMRRVLLHEWDPIGVGDEPQCIDEYDSYIPGIIRLVDEGADRARIADHLYNLETVAMGCTGDRERGLIVAQRLLSLSETPTE